MQEIPDQLLSILACPIDGKDFQIQDNHLCCSDGHRFPVVQGVPVLIRDDVPQTIWMAGASSKLAEAFTAGKHDDTFFVDTLGLSSEQRESVRAMMAKPVPDCTDPVASYLVSATNGIAYAHLVGHVVSYPIPEIDFPVSNGRSLLLDIGCSWGRWSIAAARKGYMPVGLDPSLGAVLAAKRLSAQLGAQFLGVVGDARHLPFKREAFDAAFSYSVFQHFSKPDALQALKETRRVLKSGGLLLVQMAAAWGLRSLQHQARRGFREPRGFEVRYWSPPELRAAFRRLFGKVDAYPDCYFGLGLQRSDITLMSPATRAVIRMSERLKRLAGLVPGLRNLADSLYLRAGF